MNTSQDTVIPPCCKSCIVEGNIDKARLAIAYEDGRDDARREFKEYLEGKAIYAKEERDADYLYGCYWDKWDDIYSAYMQIINELFN